MATLQVIAVSRSHADALENRATWKRGDIVAVHEDGVCVEPPAPNGKTVFIHVPGVAASVFQDMLEGADEEFGEAKEGQRAKRILRRRNSRLRIDDWPAPVKLSLRTTREVVLTKKQIRDYVLDRRGE